MHLPLVWPVPLGRHLRETYGEASAVEPLSGMSGAQVYRVRLAGASVIVKGNVRPAEVLFYEKVAPIVQAHGVPTPYLKWSWHRPESRWIVLEDIPRPFPRERWSADPELLAALRRIHAIPVAAVPAWPGMFRPQWTEQMTEAALSCFPMLVAGSLRPLLSSLRGAYAHLFEPACCISGDPNPTNWGLRDDSALVLYDWERFGYGTPALDLAITIPGLGDDDAFERVAGGYLREQHAAGPALPTVEQLSRDIGVAKIWSVVEFLSMYAGGTVANGAATAGHVVRLFPQWVRGIGGMNAPPA